jgi:translation initiation factor IF-3
LSRNNVFKEVKFHVNTGEHDIRVKAKQIERFLKKGAHVKISVYFRGRENAHPELGEVILSKLVDEFKGVASQGYPIRLRGNVMDTQLDPRGKKDGE